MDKQEANKVIAEKLSQAQALIRECEAIADETGVGFSWNLAYGMGGWYNPDDSEARVKFRNELIEKFMSEGMTRDEAIDHIEREELVEEEFDWASSEFGWQSSSSSC
jgi:hypothetical protein